MKTPPHWPAYGAPSPASMLREAIVANVLEYLRELVALNQGLREQITETESPVERGERTDERLLVLETLVETAMGRPLPAPWQEGRWGLDWSGRPAGYPAGPPQIRTCGTPASGSSGGRVR